MTVATLLFHNSDKAGVSAAHYALALLHCIHTDAHTGDNQPFPLPQHDIVCTCMGPCVCKWRLFSMWQMGSHSSSSHGGGRKSLLDAITFTPPKNFLDVGGDSCWTGQTQDLCKCIGRMCLGVTTPNRAKKGQSGPKQTKHQTKSLRRELLFNIMQIDLVNTASDTNCQTYKAWN